MLAKRVSLSIAVIAIVATTAAYGSTTHKSRKHFDFSVSPSSSPFHFPSMPDDWLGGTGNWSNGGDWSAGVPTLANDVVIYSGGDDNVTLDVGSTTIDSLTLGGVNNGTTSVLTDGGTTQNLTIINALTVGQSGVLQLTGGSNVTAGTLSNSGSITTGYANGAGGGNTLTIIGNLTNAPGASLDVYGTGDFATVATLNNGGYVRVNTGATLNLTNQPGGITDVVAGSQYNIGGSFTAGLNSAFANLTSIEGQVLLFGQNDVITPGGGTLTLSSTGYLDPENGSTVAINGNVNNSGQIVSGYYGGGGNTLTISGSLSNSGGFELYGPSDMATIGGDLTSSGSVFMFYGSTLQIDGNVSNSGSITTGYANGAGGGNTLTIIGNLTNAPGASLDVYGTGDFATVATLNNGGYVRVNTGATLNLTNQPGGITDVVAGSQYNIGGSFTAGLNSAFANLTSIEGQVLLFGQNDVITPGGGTLTLSSTGYLDPENGSTVAINGNVNNSGQIVSGYYGGGGNTLTISGSLSNSGGFELYGPSDMATIGGDLTSSGSVFMFYGSTLQIDGNVSNSGSITTGYANGAGGGNTLTIIGNLTNAPGASLDVYGTGDFATVATLNNGGYVRVNTGATLNLTNQPGGITDVVAGSQYNIGGSFTAGLNSAFANLTSIEGQVLLFGQNDVITPGGGTLTLSSTGYLDPENGSTVAINGNVNNSGQIVSGYYGGGGNTLTISGSLSNSGGFELYGPSDMATIGGDLTSSGSVFMFYGSTLQIDGNVSNSESITTGYANGAGGGNTLTIIGNLTNAPGASLDVYGTGDFATVATLNNGGYVRVNTGATLNLTNQPGGITDVVAGSQYNIGGSFTAGLNSAFANLTSIEGQVLLFGQNDVITPGGGTLTLSSTGYLDPENGSTVAINGNVNNSGQIVSGYYGGGGNTLTISGSLSNSGGFELYGPSDMATIGGDLTSSGSVFMFYGSTLQIDGNVSNSESITTGYANGAGGGNTLTIIGNLTNAPGASLDVYGTGDFATVATLNNGGYVRVNTGATLNLTNQPGGITDVVAGSQYNIGGSFTAGLNSAFANLTSIEGQVLLFGQNDVITPGGGTLTLSSTGYLDPENGSTVAINGNVNNSGQIVSGYYGGGGNTLTISGSLSNSGGFELYGPSDMATIGGDLTSSGSVFMFYGSTLQIDGNVSNSESITTGYANGAGGGNTLTIIGNLTNAPGASLDVYGTGDFATVATLNNGGYVRVNTGATLLVGTGIAGAPGYFQLANGTLGEYISMAGFGVIVANGAAHLDGTLDILLQNGFNPVVGSTYDFLESTSGDLSGTFASIENDIFNHGTEKWLVTYDNADGLVFLTAETNSTTPEPGTLLLLGSGVLALGGVARKRFRK